MSIEAVVFDIGNVLIRWDPVRVYDARIGAARRARFFAEVPIEAMNLEVDRGADMAESVAALAEAHPGWAAEIRLWHDVWLEMASPEIPGSVRLLRALRARGVPVFALTNFGAATFGIAERAYPFLAEFDGRVISALEGTVKPEPRIYEIAETLTGRHGPALLFTDDRPENIEAAAARGWQTHLFEGPEGLARRLVTEGLLDPAEAGSGPAG